MPSPAPACSGGVRLAWTRCQLYAFKTVSQAWFASAYMPLRRYRRFQLHRPPLAALAPPPLAALAPPPLVALRGLSGHKRVPVNCKLMIKPGRVSLCRLRMQHQRVAAVVPAAQGRRDRMPCHPAWGQRFWPSTPPDRPGAQFRSPAALFAQYSPGERSLRTLPRCTPACAWSTIAAAAAMRVARLGLELRLGCHRRRRRRPPAAAAAARTQQMGPPKLPSLAQRL